MLRRTFFATVLSLAVCVPVAAAPTDDEILAAEKEWAAAVVANDFAKIDRFMGEGLIYAHSTGAVETKDEYMKRLKTGAQNYDAIDYEKTAVQLYGDTAVAHSHVTMRGTSNGSPFNDRLMMMHLWVKADGRWQLAAHQTTRLP